MTESSETPARLMCRRCGRVFTTSESLSQHSARKHELTTSEMACPICRVGLSSYQDYKTHTLGVHNQIVQSARDTQATCGVCNERCFAKEIWKHMRVFHLYRSSYTTECQVCAQLVIQKDLSIHYAEEHPSILCYRCSEVFCSIRAYNKHFSLVHEKTGKAENTTHVKLIKCGLCNEMFEDSRCITMHIFSVHLELVPTYSTICLYCCQVLAFNEYIPHLNSQHARIQCMLCSKSFSRFGYQYHLYAHTSS